MARLKILMFSILLIFVRENNLLSQELTGTVRGTVTDQSGLAIVGTDIVVTGPTSMKVVTDQNGDFILVLIPGNYTIVFVKDGFANLQHSMDVHAGVVIVLNASLEISSVTQTITVTVEGKAPEIDTGSSTISTTITSETQTKLPSGIGFIGQITLAPGVRVEPVGGGIMSDGSSRAENNFFINGVNISDALTGSMRVMNNMPREFMEETSVGRSSDARFGGSFGATINGVLKRGGNEMHGSVWTYLAHDALNATPKPYLRFSPLDDEQIEYFKVPEDYYRVLIPGYEVGGALIKKKVFFFTGSRPTFSNTERSVEFLKNNLPGTFTSSSREDKTVNKLDLDLTYHARPLQISLAHMYSPWRVRGFLPSKDGTSSPDTLWSQRGFRAPSTLVLWKGTYFPTSKLVLSAYGGWNYTNSSDAYGLSKGPSIVYLTPNIGQGDVPRKFQATTGDFTPNNLQTVRDKFLRSNLYLEASYLTRVKKGVHFIKFGYHRDHIASDALASTYPDGRFLVVWGRSRLGTTGDILAGKYGYYVEDAFETSGIAESRNHAFYIQDNWQMRKNLTWNLGLRAESEYIPSFLTDAKHGSKAISFGFTDKIAPYIGVAYDPSGTGRQKISAAFSITYDVTKGNLARSAFGGDKWLQCFYPLNDADVTQLKKGIPSKAFECFNLRVPANDLIDPALKPMQQRMITLGHERSFENNLILSVYGIQKSVVRAIEDVGRLAVNNGIVEEQFTITNPGEGRSIDPSWFPAGYPSPITPKARREYSALETRLDKLTGSYFFSGSYTLSRFWGNYSGLASSDERGRINPNTNRDFDLTVMSRDRNAKLVYGKLATDRPHVVKILGYKTISYFGNHNVGTSFIWQSGTPLSTQVLLLSNVPAFSYGRGDMGRTPAFSETSLSYAYEFKLKGFNEHQKAQIELVTGNIFNQGTVLDKVTGLIHPNDGSIYFPSSASVFRGYDPETLMKEQGLRKNPAYGMAAAFQAPRSIRLSARFFF